MAKKAKDTQTDYTRGGKAISDTAIPLYQTNLNRMDDYLSNPSTSIDSYLDKYYSNNANQSDFMRTYNRNMANATAQNYAATGGGYTSSGQRAYDDQQRYMNDLASRLQQYGVTSAYNMANQDYQNMLAANNAYQNAYSLGQDYSNIERYNNMVGQANSFQNQLAGHLSGAGKVFSAIPLPWTQAVGAGLQATGDFMSIDTSGLESRLGGGSAQSSGAGATSGMYTNIGQGLYATANENPDSILGRMFGNSNNQFQITTNNTADSRTTPIFFPGGFKN